MAVDRRELLVLLFYTAGPKGVKCESITGVTRLQKLLYILKREQDIEKISRNYFTFEPYKFGPYASQLYDDIAFLENLGFIESGGKSLNIEPFKIGTISLLPLVGLGDHSASIADIEEARAGYDYQIGNDPDTVREDDLQEKVFRLTPKGADAALEILQQLPSSESEALQVKLAEVKRFYGSMSLRRLLNYVYSRYPESAVASEIIDKV